MKGSLTITAAAALTPIRPGYPPLTPQPQAAQPNVSGKSAIFALARAQAAAQSAPVENPTPAGPQRAVNRVAEASAEPPAKLLRAGSLLDIKV